MNEELATVKGPSRAIRRSQTQLDSGCVQCAALRATQSLASKSHKENPHCTESLEQSSDEGRSPLARRTCFRTVIPDKTKPIIILFPEAPPSQMYFGEETRRQF